MALTSTDYIKPKQKPQSHFQTIQGLLLNSMFINWKPEDCSLSLAKLQASGHLVMAACPKCMPLAPAKTPGITREHPRSRGRKGFIVSTQSPQSLPAPAVVGGRGPSTHAQDPVRSQRIALQTGGNTGGARAGRDRPCPLAMVKVGSEAQLRNSAGQERHTRFLGHDTKLKKHHSKSAD